MIKFKKLKVCRFVAVAGAGAKAIVAGAAPGAIKRMDGPATLIKLTVNSNLNKSVLKSLADPSGDAALAECNFSLLIM